jgi:hypothetical protein
MDHLAQERATLLRTIKARERRLMFDWLVDQAYAIADYGSRPAAQLAPSRFEYIKVRVTIGPTVEI